MNDENDKNSLFNQESSIEEKFLKNKIYSYFYSIIKETKDFNLSVLCILTILEMIQLISYAFSEPHLNSWKIKSSHMKTISTVLGALRISPLMRYVKYKIFIIIFFILIVLIFIFCIFILMQVLFKKSYTKIFEWCASFTQIIINPLVIFFYIPITEILLMQFKCSNGKIDVIIDSDKCWNGLYYLYVILGIIFAFLFFVCLLFHLLFYFSPFQYHTSTVKIYANNDVILFISKLLLVLRFIWVKDEYLSIVILLIISLFILTNEYTNETYNNKILEKMLNVRNIAVFWTYFVLLLSKFFENTQIDGIVFFLLFGYPVVIYLGIIKFKVNDSDFSFVIDDDLTDVNRYIYQTKFLIKLINSFLIDSKNLKYSNEFENHKNDILIRGIIKTHIKSCILDDCPLNKFMENQGNYTVQKQCLLNYMNTRFNNGIKAFPSSRKLKVYYIQFNYSKRCNLNGVRVNLAALSKLEMNFKDEFITYCLKQEIKKAENKSIDYNNDNDDTEFEADLIDQKYRRLKYLIENVTKLYVEFWGIFASNITNNLNSQKLFTLGEKLNKYLEEIKFLWNNDLKNKKISPEHQGIVQLYSKFLKEILWDQKKSVDVSKKINEDNRRHFELKKNDDNQTNNNMDSILENQDFIIFANSNEKGKCNIVQCSNSISFLFGYQKSEIIGKPIEILMPNIFVDGHKKMLEERIKKISVIKDSKRDSSREFSKKKIFVLAQTKVGYLIPVNTRFNIYDDNDYSNSFVIKTKFETRDTKSIYAYYILTKDDFTIVNISASALYLGLSMDLLKKYVIKLNLLIRGKNNEEINLLEKYYKYEDEPKPITWVFPDIIYPKDDTKKMKHENIHYLIEKSNKKNFNLQINRIQYYEDKIIGFSFRFTEINKQKKVKFQHELFLPINKKEIMFDLLNLNYIRAEIVTQKTGLRNLRENDLENKFDIGSPKNKDKNKNKNISFNVIQESSEEELDTNKKKEIVLSRETLLELQTKESTEVKLFINQLPFYGNDISLEKHRPNKEIYPVGRTAEPSIKIQLSRFIIRMDEKKENLKRLTSTKTMDNIQENIINDNNINNNNSSLNQNQDTKSLEEVNREITTDTITSLSKLFREKSLTYMSISSILIFIFILLIAILEFSLSFHNLNSLKDKLTYVEKSYKILNNMLYIKYFVTEGVLANELKSKINESYVCLNNVNVRTFVNNIRSELSLLRQEFSDNYGTLSSSSNKFSNEYIKYTSETYLNLTRISGNNTIYEKFLLSDAMSRIPSLVFYVSTVTDGSAVMDMSDRNIYEFMHNLLNDYYICWKDATFILVKDAKFISEKGNFSIIILVISFIISISFMIITWKLLNAFGISRARPINLILTIKKKIFENLKNSAENFSNQLLNKFFGNDDNEEESQQDYQANIQMNDVNIVKFKSPVTSTNKENLYLSLFLQTLFFFLLFEIYIIVKYIGKKTIEKNISKYIDVYNVTEYSQIYSILSIDIIKSYFYDTTIPIFKIKNNIKTRGPFFEVFYNASDALEDHLIATYESNCFLRDYYVYEFTKYYYDDFSKFIPNIYKNYSLTKNGFVSMIIKFYESLKYLSSIYFSYYNDYATKKTINLINDEYWPELNKYIQNYIRYWFKGIIDLITKSLDDYINKGKLVHITLIIIFIVLLILYYSIILAGNMEKLLSLLKQSRDLVNLIPEEIKHIIVAKLNE